MKEACICQSRSASRNALLHGWLPALAMITASMLLLAMPASPLRAQQLAVPENMTGRYHFIGPEDTLAILQEENTLKGYIDVFQGPMESDAILSYPLTIGSRNHNAVSFRTRKIHDKYYRFKGAVERGTGKKPGDSDYLRLVGELETITSNSVTGTEDVKQQQVTLKSFGKGEGPPD